MITHTPRKRRTNAEMNGLRDTIMQICEKNQPLSVRQLFYLLTTGGHIEKTEPEYKRVIATSAELRVSGELPFGWIRDDSRRRMQLTLHKSPALALQLLADTYAYDVQSTQPTRLEIWCEKETLSGVLWRICAEYRIDLLPCKGMPSLTYRYEAAVTANKDGRPFQVLYIGDSDPTGELIDPTIDKFMNEHLKTEWLGIKRIAVTDEQRHKLNLPTRPPKEAGERAGRHADIGCVEVEAIPPDTLRQILRNEIESCLDGEALERARLVDDAQRQTIAGMVETLGGVSSTPDADPGEPIRQIVLYELDDDGDPVPMNRSNPLHREFWGDRWHKNDELHAKPPGKYNLTADGRVTFVAQILRKNPMHLLLVRPG